MRSNPNRFLHATLCLENLSSGENLAGCADNVGFPSGLVFCNTYREKKEGGGGGEFREINCSIEINVVLCSNGEKKRRQNRATNERHARKDNDVTHKVSIP